MPFERSKEMAKVTIRYPEHFAEDRNRLLRELKERFDSTFPHHKHVGNKMLPAIEPTLKQVLDEVNELLQKGVDSPSSQPKRRRQRKPRR
jgi:hypothetical protein